MTTHVQFLCLSARLGQSLPSSLVTKITSANASIVRHVGQFAHMQGKNQAVQIHPCQKPLFAHGAVQSAQLVGNP